MAATGRAHSSVFMSMGHPRKGRLPEWQASRHLRLELTTAPLRKIAWSRECGVYSGPA